jgi:hypothetical protein
MLYPLIFLRIVDLTYDSGHDDHGGETKKPTSKPTVTVTASKKDSEEKEVSKEEAEDEQCYNPKDDRDIDKKKMYRERREQFEEALKSDAPTSYNSSSSSNSRSANMKKMRHDYFHK